jgi:MFS family permease
MSPEKKRVIILLAAVQFIFTLDTTFMNVSISTLVKDLNTTVSAIQAAITFYTLVMAAFMIAGAKLGDIIGRKRAFVIGLSVYAVGSLVTSLSPNIYVLTFGWSLLEGLGAALAIPAMFSLITGNFEDGPGRSRAYAALAAMAAVGAATGPIVGGLLTTYASWRLGFAAEVVVALLVLVNRKTIKDAAVEGPKPGFDLTGFVLSAVGLSILVIGILLANSYGIFKARADFYLLGIKIAHTGGISPTIEFAIVGLLVLAGFVWWQFRQTKNNKPALIAPVMFKNRTVRAGSASILVQQFLMAGVIFSLSLILQLSVGYNAFLTGLTILPMSVALLIVARTAAGLADTYAPRTMVITGFAILLIGTAFLGFRAGSVTSGWDFLLPLIIMGAGLGFTASQLSNLVQSSVRPEQTNEASGMSLTFQNLGASLGTALAGSVAIAVLISTSQTLITENTTLNAAQKQTYSTAVTSQAQLLSNQQIESKLGGQSQSTINAVVTINEQARQKALSWTVLALALAGLVGLVTAWRLPRRRQTS